MEPQAITAPHGITVFGSATLRVAPDVAIISFNVSSTQSSPAEAFSNNRAASQKIQAYLNEANVPDAGGPKLHWTKRTLTAEESRNSLDTALRHPFG